MKKFNLIIFTAIALLTFAGAASADMITEFSANFVEKFGNEVETGKIYVAKNMSRFEIDGSDEIIVNRYDKQVTWFIYPKLRRYVEEPCVASAPINPAAHRQTAAAGTAGDLTREFLGHEEVDSYRMKKYLVTVKYHQSTSADETREDKYYEWYRDNFPFPVKTESLSGHTSYEYTKIKPEAPKIENFLQPKRYKKVTFNDIEILQAAQ